jgi:hypothetical protein
VHLEKGLGNRRQADGQKLVIGTGIGVGGYLYTSSDARIWTKRF